MTRDEFEKLARLEQEKGEAMFYLKQLLAASENISALLPGGCFSIGERIKEVQAIYEFKEKIALCTRYLNEKQ